MNDSNYENQLSTDLEDDLEEVSSEESNFGKTGKTKPATAGKTKTPENKVVKLLEKNPLGMTLPEMAGGVRQQKKIRTLRPMLAAAIQEGLIMPVSQRAGHTVYRLVKVTGRR
jgi:hypothetical protein